MGEGRGIYKIGGVEEVSGEKIRIECKWEIIELLRLDFFEVEEGFLS